jgi:signal transduction histidine kinase
MEISDFIDGHFDEIIGDWLHFLRQTVPAAEILDQQASGEEAAVLLKAIAACVTRPVPEGAEAALQEAARAHACSRVLQGFSLHQMASEYRNLRHYLLRKWTLVVDEFGRAAHENQLRFNEVIDSAMAHSAAKYAGRVELARDLFLGVLGHDLRTPLAAIANSVSVLRHGQASDELREEAIERISHCAKRMDRMIEDLLDFTRTRLGTQLPMSPAPCDLREICKQAVDELSASHPGTRINFSCSGDLQGIWDCERLAQLLSNLVENALRYGAGDTPVSVDVAGLEDRIEMSVHNLGQIIPPEEQRAIFDPLRRGVHQPPADSPGSGGLGLGLYIAQQIAASHRGGIRLSSSAAGGTRFIVTLAREGRRPAPPASTPADS